MLSRCLSAAKCSNYGGEGRNAQKATGRLLCSLSASTILSPTTLSVFGVGQLGRMADSRAEPKFCLWFLWGNGNELRGL